MSVILVGQFVEPGSAYHSRVEVLIDRPPAKSDAAPIVFITKYADRQIGERSMGMSAATARQVAELLNRAADACALPPVLAAPGRPLSESNSDTRAYTDKHGTLLGSSS